MLNAKPFRNAMLMLLVGVAARTADAAAPPPQAVYPGKGQSAEQQKTDEAQCGVWAIERSGYDPANPPSVAKAQPAPVTGSGARVRGATAGAVVGAATGNDVDDAAAKGAVAGGIVRRNKNRRAAAQANQAQAAQMQEAEQSYWNARQVCLEGRGYNVK